MTGVAISSHQLFVISFKPQARGTVTGIIRNPARVWLLTLYLRWIIVVVINHHPHPSFLSSRCFYVQIRKETIRRHYDQTPMANRRQAFLVSSWFIIAFNSWCALPGYESNHKHLPGNWFPSYNRHFWIPINIKWFRQKKTYGTYVYVFLSKKIHILFLSCIKHLWDWPLVGMEPYGWFHQPAPSTGSKALQLCSGGRQLQEHLSPNHGWPVVSST